MNIEELETKETVNYKILGTRNPIGMSLGEFNSSPDLLFHGASQEFHFDLNYDYADRSKNDESTWRDGGETLGPGLYLSESRDVAREYAFRRSKGEFVENFLPFNARMLDLRDQENTKLNISFPKDLAMEWKEYFNSYLKQRTPRQGFIGQSYDKLENDYSIFLEELLKLDQFNIREMLKTAPLKELRSKHLPSPIWGKQFVEFMKSKGFDGVIYNEGVDLEAKRDETSYVFYNLNKIGTYDSWQKKRYNLKKVS